MIIAKNALATASPKTKRRARYEFELELVAQDCIFESGKAAEFRRMAAKRVYADPRFEKLPQYRQACVDAYIRGALDYAARSIGLEPAQPPDYLTPKRAPSSAPPPPKRSSVRPAARRASDTAPPPPVVIPKSAPLPTGHSLPEIWGDWANTHPPAPVGFIRETPTPTFPSMPLPKAARSDGG